LELPRPSVCNRSTSQGRTRLGRELNESLPLLYKLLRGGSWGDFPQFERSAFRISYTPGSRGGIPGFRLTKMLP
jgi:formylglycine-generating enzyme required for sulfatase activity